MTLKEKIGMADEMIKLGYISQRSYDILLDGFALIANDKINSIINRAR
jgi:hypothetical protein